MIHGVGSHLQGQEYGASDDTVFDEVGLSGGFDIDRPHDEERRGVTQLEVV